jgi:hypothetical protein
MPLYMAHVRQAADSVLARDFIVNTLWFNDHGLTTDPANLANSIRDVFKTFWQPIGAREVEVRLYEHSAGDPTMGDPKATAIVNKGSAPGSGMPREIAICLSFYAGTNSKRNRGRIYVAPYGASPIGLRPDPSLMSRVLGLATSFAAIGGADVDWVVHSRVDDVSRNVSDAWVDDEWDIQRSRGLRPTTRQTVHTGS